MTSKVNTGKFSYQYGYDLRNRLASANITRKEGLQDVTITSSYAYNTAGIRTRAEQTINGVTQNRYFLLDSGHTGYAQVFEETSTLGGNLVRSYVLGDDVLSQNVGGVTSHLLYDGHGNTRQLAGDDGAVTANYAYDAYGKMLGGNPNVTDRQSSTDLLYAGEQFDPGLQMEYLRARYYDQDNGRFNRLDPFDGNSEDPQSLHKYAYAHCDPVNGIDPSGEFLIGLIDLLGSFATSSYLRVNHAIGVGMAYVNIKVSLIVSYLAMGMRGAWHYVANILKTSSRLPSGAWARIQHAFASSHQSIVTLQQSIQNGFNSHKELVAQWGEHATGKQVHHFVQQHAANIARFGAKAIHSTSNSICLDSATHRSITNFTNSGKRLIDWMNSGNYANFSTLRDYIASLPWEQQYRWGQSLCQWAIKHGGDMSGFRPPL